MTTTNGYSPASEAATQSTSLLRQRLDQNISPQLRNASWGGNMQAANRMWGQNAGVSRGIFNDYLQNQNGVTGLDAAEAASNTGVMGGATQTALDSQKGMLTAKAFDLENQENSRHQEASTFLRAAYDDNTQPTVTSGLINSMFGKMADSATQTHSQNMDFIRQQIGGSGVRGGVAADLGMQAEMARMGQITGGLRDLGIYEMQQKAADSSRNLQAAFGMADFMNQSPSLLGLDALQMNLEFTDRQAGRNAAMAAAAKQAEASKTAGLMGLGGSVAGGLFGLLG